MQQVKRKIPRYLTIEEIQKLKQQPLIEGKFFRQQLKAAKDRKSKWLKYYKNKVFLAKRDYAIICLFYSSGIRLSELINLNLEDINFDRAIVRVLGKGRLEREGELTDEAIRALKSYLKVRELWKGKESEILFLTRIGERIKKRNIEQKIDDYGKKASIKRKVTPHMFRHSIATHLLDHGMDIRRVQSFLGHTSIASTQIYTHIINDTQKEETRRHHPDYK